MVVVDDYPMGEKIENLAERISCESAATRMMDRATTEYARVGCPEASKRAIRRAMDATLVGADTPEGLWCDGVS